MKKLFLLLILLTIVNANTLAEEKPVLISAEKAPKEKTKTIKKVKAPKTSKRVKKEKVVKKSCSAGVAWKNPEDIKSEGGEWQVDDSECNKYKWLGEKPEGMVCAQNCTGDSLEEMGMD